MPMTHALPELKAPLLMAAGIRRTGHWISELSYSVRKTVSSRVSKEEMVAVGVNVPQGTQEMSSSGSDLFSDSESPRSAHRTLSPPSTDLLTHKAVHMVPFLVSFHD